MDHAALDAAFRATIYRVEIPEGCFYLRIGVADPVFDDCLRARGVGNWGIITACNPRAARLSNDENRLRQMQLRESLNGLGWTFFPACNLDPKGVWPPEPAYLILRMDETRFCALAAAYSQNAVVRGETGSPPCLLWIA